MASKSWSSKKPVGFLPPAGRNRSPSSTPKACTPRVIALVPLRPTPTTTMAVEGCAGSAEELGIVGGAQ
jgi:hypothetical protein